MFVPLFLREKNQPQQSAAYRECGSIRYKVKRKEGEVKVTFRTSAFADKSLPVALEEAVVRLAFDEVQKKYGDRDVIVKV